MNASASACFHCGEPTEGGRWRALVDGAPRQFCCVGCQAAAEAIEAAGLSDYYRTRSAAAPRALPAALPAALFDRAECAVAYSGSAAGGRQARLALEGVRCPACLWLIAQRLRGLPGVLGAEADYASQTASVRWQPGAESLAAAVSAIEMLGYRARPIAGHALDQVQQAAVWRDGERAVVAVVLGMTVMNAALALYLAGSAAPPLALWEQVVRVLSALLCLPLLAWCGADFFGGAWRDLRGRRLGMDVPVALGLAAAYAGSLIGLADGGPVYFDAIAMLVPAVLGARWLEARARRAAAAALDRLSVIEPQLALRCRADGADEAVPALDLAPGDELRVRPGEAVPADGVLGSDSALLDESHLTGEPYPRRRVRGEAVAAGSVVIEQALRLTVTRVGAASTLGELRALIERGLTSRPALAALADRWAPALVAVVLAAAALTWLAWQVIDPARALPAAIAVLVVSCPCALALATPLTLALAAGGLARAGIVPLRLAALDALATAPVAAFDKTGTLTRGKPVLVAFETCGGLDAAQARALAAALERDSLHPIARALGAGESTSPVVERLEQHPGAGVSGELGTVRWWLGARGFAPGVPALDERARQWAAEGRLVAVLSDGGHRGALFAFEDALRPGARLLGPALQRAGVRYTACLSGDPGAGVARAAVAAGLDEALGACSPHGKLDWLARARAAHGAVLMVGDGLNDAPTLAAADASLSFADAAQLARASADFLIAGESLDAVPRARRLARRARRVLHQNLAWAAGYNLLAIPLAASSVIAPWLAALGMAASSVLVVANALRLKAAPAAHEAHDAAAALPAATLEQR
jgi:Cu2+-exporting ATPase